MKNENHPYYALNAERFLDDARMLAAQAELTANILFAEEAPASLAVEVEKRFKQILPSLPYIGGDANFLTQMLISGATILCIYQVMQADGKNLEETGELVYETILAANAASEPGRTPNTTQKEQIISARRDAAAFSQANPYAYGWQTTFVEGDGEHFDWGVDYSSCGICKLFEDHQAAEFIPYVCFLDLPLYKARGIGLVRTKTLARGDDKCDFRFNLRAEYSLEWLPGFYQEEKKRNLG